WFEGLDAVALYSFMCKYNPRTYMEIGSGYSSKFARKAIEDHNLRSQIVSIDPEPRAEIDEICDRVIRRRAQTVDMNIFDELDEGDILFVDGSHRCLMNSDATVVFLDILPRLRSGVLIHIHDIFLPYDYPTEWSGRYYSEQYLLAAQILAGGNRFDILLPANFVNEHEQLSRVLDPLWSDPKMAGANKDAYSFWMTVN
ncbi:MAG: class I SAM-dependent methyltransferase, partial [Chloroflexi bacterium]|nr:class I SAM-dependent methyltransferase [Chloroflexota bacterium]